QPLPRSRQASTRLIHSHKGNITYDRSLAAFFDDRACPSRFRQPPQQFIDTIGRIRRCFEALPSRFASFARPSWSDQCRCAPPNQLIGRDFGKVPLAQSSDLITKGRRVAVERISSDPAPQQDATLPDGLEQVDGDLWFGEEGQGGWQTDLLTQLSHL